MKTLVSAACELVCTACNQTYSAQDLHTVSPCCQQILVARYSDTTVFLKNQLAGAEASMWRYAPMLPLRDMRNKVSLGEGFTPMLRLESLGTQYPVGQLWLKDEGQNPTGSFKARGLSMAISKAKELGVQACIIPTAGNAGGAMAAYCAKAGMKAVVAMPTHTPDVFKQECLYFGAELVLIEGLISDCGKYVRERNATGEYFDVSTLKEPYRLEGKKTLGYEIAEQFGWTLPDVILYPTGGGTGLIGIWKAFQEMKNLGWLPQDIRLPRMVAVQAENCQPIVQRWQGHIETCKTYQGKPTAANGLAVPNPFAENLILQVLRESSGTAIAVSDAAMLEAVQTLARREGLFVAPEGGALLAAMHELILQNWIQPHEQVLLLNTGSAYKYIENMRL